MVAELKSKLRIGQLVYIEITDNDGLTTRYSSRVENVDSATLTLVCPIKKRIPLYLPSDLSVNVWYWDSASMYTFRTTVIKSINDRIPQLLVKKPESIKKVQKREFVRIQCSINVKLTYQSEDGQEQELLCRTRDISAGGMMLVVTKPISLSKDQNVSLQFELDKEKFKVTAAIIWNDWELDSDGIKRNMLGVKFIHLSEKNRQTIIKFVYQRQIEQRRKGLL